MEPELIPVTYRCGHTINILSPGVSDPKGIMRTAAQPVKLEQPCWNCDTDAGYLKQCPPETTELLRLKKRGEA